MYKRDIVQNINPKNKKSKLSTLFVYKLIQLNYINIHIVYNAIIYVGYKKKFIMLIFSRVAC